MVVWEEVDRRRCLLFRKWLGRMMRLEERVKQENA